MDTLNDMNDASLIGATEEGFRYYCVKEEGATEADFKTESGWAMAKDKWWDAYLEFCEAAYKGRKK